MEIVKEAAEIVAQQRPAEKQNRLEGLSSIFEYARDLDPIDVSEGVQILLNAALQVNPADAETKEAFFHAIDSAIVIQNVGDHVNWDGLIPTLPSLEKPILEYALGLLGLSGQEKYLPVIEKYTHHSDPEIKAEAEDAINEITYRVAHHSEV